MDREATACVTDIELSCETILNTAYAPKVINGDQIVGPKASKVSTLSALNPENECREGLYKL